MSELTIRFDGDDQEVAAHVKSLVGYLKDTEKLARAKIEAVKKPTKPGQMGGLEDFLRMFAEDPRVFIAALGMVGGWMNWLTPRRAPENFTVSVTCPNGAVISGTVRSAADASRLQEQLRRDCLPCEGAG
ncbi:hypothetical protein [Streptomyces sp. NPDC002088]|uniref:effector-associated constant component EACC1 n=1 Tax=unclassified Streptomyces TaxID=2593676 RepID=UPI0033228073